MQKIDYIERDKCYLCGNSDFEFECNIDDYDTNLGSFKLLKCKKCGMYYTSPYPSSETLSYLYENSESRNFDTHNSPLFEYLKDFLAERLIKKITKEISDKNISIVDFGCGNGRFSKCFQKLFPDAFVYPVDFSLTFKNDYKNYKYMDVQEFYKSNQKYDLIFIRHVIEHVENPKEFLKIMLNKITDKGFIYIETPNIKNGLRVFFNKYLPSYYPPYHLVHFTKQNLEYLLKDLNTVYEISYDEMPIISNLIANMTHKKLNNIHRFIGMLLHPFQLLLCLNSHTVLTAKIRKKSGI